MQRRQFSREFKLEAAKLVLERGVSVSQAARDLDLQENMLRKWMREQLRLCRGVAGSQSAEIGHR